MGVFTDLYATSRTIDLDPPSDGASRPLRSALDAMRDRIGDRDYPTGSEARNESQEIGSVTADDGTYTLTFELADGTTFTTGDIDHDDNAAAIEAAIDAAAEGVVTGWTDGDISVADGPIDTDTVVLTFDGDSVAGANHQLVVVDNSLTNSEEPSEDPEVTVVEEGQTNRAALGVLVLAGVVGTPLPNQGESDVVTAPTNPQTNPHYPDQETIRALAREAALVDNNADLETAILAAAGISSR